MEPSEYICPTCSSPMTLRQGRSGMFLGCSAYPRCRTAQEVDAEGRPVPPPDSGVRCARCGSPMVIRRGPHGRFLRCSAYPRCRHTEPMGPEA